jgi:hypothetical protein
METLHFSEPMKKTLPIPALVGILMFFVFSAVHASHPLLQNGWLKSVTDTSVTIKLPPQGADEATFEFAPKLKISFNGVDGSPADLQELAESMGKTRILINLRRETPESSMVVLIAVKADNPNSSTPTPTEPAPPSVDPVQ